ncbi:MAG: hypothetical protein HY898_09310 [Deltaproteobacteria bacterium]|nr:hypothetical protein [Deltaproteobacteria bacterium]
MNAVRYAWVLLVAAGFACKSSSDDLPVCVCGESSDACRPCTRTDGKCTAFAAMLKCTDGCLESQYCEGGGGWLHCASSSQGPTCSHCDSLPSCEADASTCGQHCSSEAGTCVQEISECHYCPGIWEGDCGVATATVNVCRCTS